VGSNRFFADECKQVLSWQVGDQYRTETGTVMTIRLVGEDSLSCDDVLDKEHLFGLGGRSRCPDACGHGALSSRMTGTVKR
jgi:hypothetical protein